MAPRDLTEAALAQAAMARRVGAWPPAGFKIGATGRRMQTLLGLSGPVAGFMAPADVLASGASRPVAGLRGAGVECELAVRLARDMPPRPHTVEEAADAVATLAAAIELVENRYGPPPIGDLAAIGTPTLVADQVYHVAAVVGSETADWRARDLTTIEGVLSLDGATRDRGQGRELLGHPLRGLAWLAGSEVAAAFGGLRAGQIIMLGSVVPTVWLAGATIVTVNFTGLAVAKLRLFEAGQGGINTVTAQ